MRGGAPRFRGGGRGFVGPGGLGPSPNRGAHLGSGGNDHRQRAPVRFRHWQTEINEPETFAETRLPDGRCYYYNTRTRETMWERPEGPGVRIIRHEEVGRVKGQGGHGQFPDQGLHDMEQGMHPQGQVGLGPNGHPFPGPGGPPPLMSFQGQGRINESSNPSELFPPRGIEDTAPGTSPATMIQGPPPSIQGSPQNMPRMMVPPPGIQRFNSPGSSQNHGVMPMEAFSAMPPPGFMQAPPQGGNPPFGMPPPGQFPAGNFGGVVPPWGFGGVVPPGGVPAPVPDPVLAQMDPEVVTRGSEWSEHLSPDGKSYYFNSKSQTSVWEKPKALIDFEVAKQEAQQRVLSNPVPGSQAEQDIAEKLKTKRVEKKVEKCRPISSTPVPGTPWCVVWTGDRRVFFYNPANKTSVWERPQDLLGRVDVDEMVRTCPDKSKAAGIKRAEATSTTSPLSDGSDKDKKQKLENAAPVTLKVTEDTHPPGEGPTEPSPKRIRAASEDSNGVIVVDITADASVQPEAKEVIETNDALKEKTAIEAEAKAARERATIPMEIRLKQFREMLVESNVSAFSTWEKELHKIVFDQRYLLLTSNERKKAFDRYVEEIVEEEKRERQNRLKETKEKFFELLAEVKPSSKTNYNDFSQKYGRDERFRAVEKTRDREAFLATYLKAIQKKEKEERAQRKEQKRDDFLELLTEKMKDYHTTYGDVRKKYESDPRFQAVEPEEREELFRNFQKRLRHDQRAREKQRRRERAAARESEKDEKGNKEHGDSQNSEKPADNTEDISEEEEGCITDDSEDEVGVDREKQERVEHSIREREKQVQRSLATHLRDRDKEREFHRHEEAVQEFQALLTDLVRNPDVTWKEAKKAIKKDRRHAFVSPLPREEMQDLFTVHIDNMARKKKQRFKELLDEHRVSLKTRWRELYPKIKNDPRCSKFHSSERKCEREFEEYMRELSAQMKVEFRELLKETKMFNYKTLETLKHNPNYMREIESHLENDRRFLQLANVPSERESLMRDYLEDLAARGPPPPPTASEPVRRK